MGISSSERINLHGVLERVFLSSRCLVDKTLILIERCLQFVTYAMQDIPPYITYDKIPITESARFKWSITRVWAVYAVSTLLSLVSDINLVFACGFSRTGVVISSGTKTKTHGKYTESRSDNEHWNILILSHLELGIAPNALRVYCRWRKRRLGFKPAVIG